MIPCQLNMFSLYFCRNLTADMDGFFHKKSTKLGSILAKFSYRCTIRVSFSLQRGCFLLQHPGRRLYVSCLSTEGGGLVFFSCWQLKTRRRAKIGVTIERFWIKNDGFSILRRMFPFYGRGKRGFFDSKAKVSFLWARKFVQLLWRYDCLQPQSFSKHFRLAVAKEPRVGLYI